MVLLGLGMAASVAPLTTTVMNSVSEKQAGTVSGINNAVSRLAGLLAIAVLGIIMLSGFNRNLTSHLKAMDLEPEIRLAIESQREKLAAIDVPQNIAPEQRAKVRHAID